MRLDPDALDVQLVATASSIGRGQSGSGTAIGDWHEDRG